MILEGSYPYVFGGVSSWAHNYIKAMPDTEFVLWCIGAREADRGKFKYELPENVVEVREVFLDSALKQHLRRNPRNIRLSEDENEALEQLFAANNPDWDVLFDLFQRGKTDPVSLLMSGRFLDELIEVCRREYPYVAFTDFFYNVRSMMLPAMYLMTQAVPEADIYHTASTGYAGLLGALAAHVTGKPFIVTEHGIYSREREEELIRADWVLPAFRAHWIRFFYSLSAIAYEKATKVTALFSGANAIQADLGCPVEKLSVIANGIHYENFCDIGPKEESGTVDIGAVVRIAKIKDVKTLIYAFAEVKEAVKNARLWILGDVDDGEYNKECHTLIDQLGLPDITFTGPVAVTEYFPKFDFTVLSSISEGQPLSVLESFAAGRAAVTTDVGCCRELIEGLDDGLGPAGLVVPPMHPRLLADALIRLCEEPWTRKAMGENGRRRAEKYYTIERSMEAYRALYNEVLEQ